MSLLARRTPDDDEEASEETERTRTERLKEDAGKNYLAEGGGDLEIEKPKIQAYLNFSDVPKEKQEAAHSAFDQAARASTVPYGAEALPAGRGMDGDESVRRERKKHAAAYRGFDSLHPLHIANQVVTEEEKTL